VSIFVANKGEIVTFPSNCFGASIQVGAIGGSCAGRMSYKASLHLTWRGSGLLTGSLGRIESTVIETGAAPMGVAIQLIVMKNFDHPGNI
jgi:hypothetical protein